MRKIHESRLSKVTYFYIIYLNLASIIQENNTTIKNFKTCLFSDLYLYITREILTLLFLCKKKFR